MPIPGGLDQNEREFGITRHVSLLLHDPGALIALKTTGECVVELPEQLFDRDHPGQYLRRLRDVSLTQAYAAATLPAPSQQTSSPMWVAAPTEAGRARLSLRHEFPSEWYGLLHPANQDGPGQMPLWIVGDRFPFQYRGRTIQVTGVSVLALPHAGASLTGLGQGASIYPDDGGTPPPRGSAPPAPPTAPANAVTWVQDAIYGTGAACGAVTPQSSAVPRVWWLSVGQADLALLLDSVEDLVLLVQYKVS